MSDTAEHILFQQLRDIAVDVAGEAAELVSRMRSQYASTVQYKTDVNNLLTEADQASERLIGDRLTTLRPNDAIVAEEASISKSSSTTGVTWVVDPVDGTINYSSGKPDVCELGPFGVSIGAVLDDGQFVAGAIVLPTLGRTFAAALGSGATCNGVPLRLAATVPLKQSIGFMERGSDVDIRRRQSLLFSDLLNDVRDIRSQGCCSADFCQVASGTAQFMFQHGGGPWDVAAGTVIVREAGGRVGGLHDDTPRGSFSIAAAANIFDELRDRIRAVEGQYLPADYANVDA